MKNAEKLEAIKLRKDEGLSLKEIAEKLKVAKSTVSLWVRNVELTQEQKNKLLEQNPIFNNQQKGIKKIKEQALIRKEEYQQEGRKKAQENNILHAIGCMLYWGEGAKNRWSVRISNSNLYLLRIFVKFLKECYNVQKEEIVIRIHCYDSENVKKIETFWMKNLGLPAECLRKTIVNNVSKYSKRKRGNTIPHGTCHLAVYSTKILQSILGAIQEYGHCKMDWSDSRS